jgi:hypothetical protein
MEVNPLVNLVEFLEHSKTVHSKLYVRRDVRSQSSPKCLNSIAQSNEYV